MLHIRNFRSVAYDARAAGTHNVYLDTSHLVDIRVNSPDAFIVHNANTIAQTGVVTLIW